MSKPFTLHLGDCLNVLREMSDNSVDSVVTDPPYGLSFMNRHWDYDVPSEDIWRECLRVLKPGGHLLAFAGTRTQHRMAVRIEDAGFEIRDMIAWVYGSGFPKSLDVSKAIDKAAGAEREVVGVSPNWRDSKRDREKDGSMEVRGENAGLLMGPPVTDAARQWQGWGTALKPALEPITVARKPLAGTVAENVLRHGTGGLNIDGCRVGSEGGTAKANIRKGEPNGERAGTSMGENISFRCDKARLDAGRWPANFIHDGSEDATEFLGSAARYFYCVKASKRDRDEGLEGFEVKQATGGGGGVGDYLSDVDSASGKFGSEKAPARNHHPTVKPTDLMRYLCRLVTPPGGVVLDPFMGSGSTGKAAMFEGFLFIGIEREQEYIDIANARILMAQIEAFDAEL